LKKIEITKHDKNPLRLRIGTEDYRYLTKLYKYFSAKVPNYFHMPQYRTGAWDGTVSMFNKTTRSIPYGLFLDFIKFHKEYENPPELKIAPDVKRIFRGPDIEPVYDLELYPYDYQQECIESALKHTKGIVRSATASGKSLMIAYVLKSLSEYYSWERNRSIIVVPTKGLITQFLKDLTSYGIDESLIGLVYAKSKQFEHPIVISTWQTLSRNHDKLPLYNTIVVDEVHGAKSHELKKIVGRARNAIYRLGFTGTMHSDVLDNWNVKSYLGPVLKDFSAGDLADMGHVAQCTVNVINVEYKDADERYSGDYNETKELLFNNKYRLELIRKLVQDLDSTALLLVGKVEKEGVILKNYLENNSGNKKVVFLSGKTSSDEEREFWRLEATKRDDLVIIATYGIFQLGINIPPLKYLVLAAPFKSKIRVLQSIGRALRNHAAKIKGAQIFDITDDTKYFGDHGLKRLRHYYAEKFTVNEFLLNEGDPLDLGPLLESLF